jgi:hypothetical protein
MSCLQGKQGIRWNFQHLLSDWQPYPPEPQIRISVQFHARIKRLSPLGALSTTPSRMKRLSAKTCKIVRDSPKRLSPSPKPPLHCKNPILRWPDFPQDAVFTPWASAQPEPTYYALGINPELSRSVCKNSRHRVHNTESFHRACPKAGTYALVPPHHQQSARAQLRHCRP